jgi:hypothetical protein
MRMSAHPHNAHHPQPAPTLTIDMDGLLERERVLEDALALCVADLQALRVAARALLPAAYAGIHFARNDGKFPRYAAEYAAAVEALAALLEEQP